MTKAKLYLLTVMIVAVGLLLGGNASAESATTTGSATVTVAAGNGTAQAQIDTIKAKIQALTTQIKNRQQPIVAVKPRPTLTQAQLDQIQVKVNEITAQTARIKAQVQILFRIRAVEAKIAALKTQMAAMAASPATAAASATTATPAASTPAAEMTKEQKEARIAQIQQQIGELNQEMQTKRASEQASGSVAEETCQGDSCSSPSVSPEKPVTIEISPKPETTSKSQPGFWQSVGNFLRKIFTF